MKNPFPSRNALPILIALSLCIASGCGQGDADTSSPENQSQSSSATPVALDTPVAFARYVHGCILTRDYEAFKKACYTVEDFEYMMTLEGIGDRTKNRLQQIVDDFASHEQRVHTNFDQFASRVLEEGTLDVVFISAQPLREGQVVPGGMDMIPNLNLHLTNDHIINLEGLAMIKGRWVMGSDDPLNYFTFGARPHHVEQKIADGYAISDLGVALPDESQGP